MRRHVFSHLLSLLFLSSNLWILSSVEYLVLSCLSQVQLLDSLKQIVVLSDWFQEENTNQGKVSFKTSDSSHEIKHTKALSRVVNLCVTNNKLYVKQSLTVGVFINILLTNHIHLAIDIVVVVVLNLSKLYPVIVSNDLVILQ